MMRHNRVMTVFLAVTILTGGLSLVTACAGDDEHEDFKYKSSKSRPEIIKVPDHFYVEDCGGCHFPYQPGFLPPRSWEKIMAGLADHFGENAELPAGRTQQIREYLLKNAAGEVNRGLPNKVAASLRDSPAPLRITETPFFRREHHELSRRVVEENSKVRSFSNCDACHPRAMQGSYSEREVRIPGFARWEGDED